MKESLYPVESERALENFFKKGNLIALRELSLRVAAEKIDIEMATLREDEIFRQFGCSEKFVVCVSPNPLFLGCESHKTTS